MKKNKHLLGNIGESFAVKFLQNKNIKIIEKNFHTPYGEIDIIGIDENELVFFEVKTRTDSFESAQSSISYKKQQKIKLSANIFLSKNPKYQTYFTRFDAILILTKDTIYKIKHLKDAFR